MSREYRPVHVCAAPPQTAQTPSALDEPGLACATTDRDDHDSLALPEGAYRLCCDCYDSGWGKSWRCDPCVTVIAPGTTARRDAPCHGCRWTDTAGSPECRQ